MSWDDKILLKVTYPKWFQIILPPILFLYLIFLLVLMVYFARDGFTWLKVGIGAFFLAILGIWLWMIPFIYSSLIATESALHATGIFRRRQKLTWDEIVRVSRPLFGIPNELVYVFSKSGQKMVLLRGMEGYPDLLKLIQSRAPYLSQKRLPEELWPRKHSWKRVWLVTAGIVAVYIILRLLFR